MSTQPAKEAVNFPILVGGILLLLAGFGLYRFFSPSPHGYLEMFFAMPVFCLGLATCGVAFLASNFRTPRRPWFWLGCALLVAAASPLLLLVWLSWQ